MTTYAQFVAWAAGLTLASCNRQESYIPKSIRTADLPFSFVRLPGGGRNMDTLSTCSATGNTRAIELVVCIEPVDLDNPSPNYDATVAMMDEVETAIKTGDGSMMVLLDFSLAAGSERIGEIDYWAVVASIEGTE